MVRPLFSQNNALFDYRLFLRWGAPAELAFILVLGFITPPRWESSGERGERNVVLKSDGLIVYKLMLDNEDADCQSKALCSS